VAWYRREQETPSQHKAKSRTDAEQSWYEAAQGFAHFDNTRNEPPIDVFGNCRSTEKVEAVHEFLLDRP